MRFTALTIFEDFFGGPLSQGLIKIAQDRGLIKINILDIRDWTQDKHRQVDDYSYGGGPGMVLKPGPIFRAVESVLPGKVILPSPSGRRLNQSMLQELSKEKHLIIICGRYEDVDERVKEKLVDLEISMGDYVLSGGELPALVLIEGITRLVEGALGNKESVGQDSFTSGLLDYPHYTRPEDFRGMRVPEVLLSGNHRQIENWRRRKALEKTAKQRPDLLDKAELTKEDLEFLEKLRRKR